MRSRMTTMMTSRTRIGIAATTRRMATVTPSRAAGGRGNTARLISCSLEEFFRRVSLGVINNCKIQRRWCRHIVLGHISATTCRFGRKRVSATAQSRGNTAKLGSCPLEAFSKNFARCRKKATLAHHGGGDLTSCWDISQQPSVTFGRK